MDFVERVLVLRGPSNIEKFRLSCEPKDDQSRIGTWISAAVNRNVKDVTFIDDQSTQQLFSLPNLVELEIDDCSWKNLVSITICAPKLQRLTIFEPHESTPANSGGCHVRIFRTHLAHFSCCGTLTNEICFVESSVVESCISLYSDFYRPRQSAWLSYKLLEGISSVETLCLTPDVLHVLDHASDLLAFPLEFRNLTSLIFDSDKLKLHRAGFWHILHNSPNLRSLHLSEVGLSEVPSNCRENGTLDPAPPCFLSCLHFVQVHNFIGREKAIAAVGFLLKNAKALDEMWIRLAGSGVMTNKIHRRLHDLPRWSKIGKIYSG
ncbi:F-BOX/RNI SUPERFAMILY PROTEIN-RELATED [Salix purpurea]|uniref:F-BOX/RNI SUPERFAMILY PROTEIN-RELATED n=1 Tax=Salix purpurea TaxID=77065 RepID=A0A9Q1AFV1_SALPP|nr:F-BOX/RNI SUPERFAMILY PROTEIN-RELATED [Salix purpurea]